MDENQLKDELKKYQFYHIIKLTENVSTMGYEEYVPIQELPLKALRSLDVKNKRIFDIGFRYPFWALKLINEVLREGGQLIQETAIFMDDNKRAILFCPTGSESSYEDTSCTFYNMKGLIDSLYSLGFVTQKSELLHTKESLNKKNFLSTIKSHLRALKPVEPYIDRVTLVCSKQSEVESKQVIEYWNSTHKLETQPLG